MLTVYTELRPALSSIFELGPGYHGTCWVDATPVYDLSGSIRIDRPVPPALRCFLDVVGDTLRDASHAARYGSVARVGVAYARVIDASRPENYMRWHVDNQDGGVRFHTAVATDMARVNLAWPFDPAVVDERVDETWRDVEYDQSDNGDLVVFTTEPHGVLPQPPRPGARTGIFFTTLYPTRDAADLYTTNNAATERHATLPVLESARG